MHFGARKIERLRDKGSSLGADIAELFLQSMKNREHRALEPRCLLTISEPGRHSRRSLKHSFPPFVFDLRRGSTLVAKINKAVELAIESFYRRASIYQRGVINPAERSDWLRRQSAEERRHWLPPGQDKPDFVHLLRFDNGMERKGSAAEHAGERLRDDARPFAGPTCEKRTTIEFDSSMGVGGSER